MTKLLLYFGLRAHNAFITYSNIYVETLPDTFLDGRSRYYAETFETISLTANKNSVKQNEEVLFEATLDPAGKDYSEVAWYINGDLVQDASDLNFKYKFSEKGDYEVKIVVDRQVAIQTVTVGEGGSSNALRIVLFSVLGAVVIGGSVVAILIMKKKKEMH